MTGRHFELKIGKGTASFSIPREQLLYELVGENRAPPADLATAYRYALAHPIDSPPLSEIVNPGETIAITVSDITIQIGNYIDNEVGFEKCRHFHHIFVGWISSGLHIGG